MASFDSNFQPASNLDEAAPAPGKDAMRDRFRGCLVGGAVGDALGLELRIFPKQGIPKREDEDARVLRERFRKRFGGGGDDYVDLRARS